jgi:hypothetical protein
MSALQDRATSTSRAAWQELSGVRIHRLQLHVLRLLRAHGPCTARELFEAAGESGTLQKRLPELVDLGLAERLSPRACRVTGRSAFVWCATDALSPGAGMAQLQPHLPLGGVRAEAVSAPEAGDGLQPVPACGPSRGARRFRHESHRQADNPGAAGQAASVRGGAPGNGQVRPGSEGVEGENPGAAPAGVRFTPSHRVTTSSRRPGVAIRGTVRVLERGAVRVQVSSVCPCGTAAYVACCTGCGVTYCRAPGHRPHACGGGRE